MNLALIDPFILAQDYPETLAASLRSGHATSLRFNRKGDLLAAGRADGTVVVWDVETNGVAMKLRGHTRTVQSLSWSRNGQYLLSSSQDWKCILWDLEDGSRLRTVRFEAPVYIAELHPYDHFLFAASLFEAEPMLVDMSKVIPTMNVLPTTAAKPADKSGEKDTDKSGESKAAANVNHNTCVTVFSPSGEYIISGTSKGFINVISTTTRLITYTSKLANGVIIYLRLTQSGRDMVVNSSDRIIRTVKVPPLGLTETDPEAMSLETEHKFQDVVNRLSWNHVAFSSTGEYVTASTYKNHDIYVWERSHGSLVKILEGPTEEVGVVEWHPHRPLVAACGLESGSLYIWSVNTPQRWSALAPDFAEVEENVEYEEKEDEFDVHPVSVLQRRRLDNEDEKVDVLTVEAPKVGETEYDDAPGPATTGSTGTGAGAGAAAAAATAEATTKSALSAFAPLPGFRMPVLLELTDSSSEDEIVAVGSGTFRRKSPGRGREVLSDSGGEKPKARPKPKPRPRAKRAAAVGGTTAKRKKKRG